MVHKERRFHEFRRELMAAVFMASLLVVLHHRLPLIDTLDKFAFLFAAASSVQTSVDEPRTVVIGIDQKTFEQDFLEQSPLNRCVMAEKLAAIYAARPARLVIDFDLSPSLAGILPHPQERTRELECEAALYAQLRDHAAATRTVLLNPFEVANEQARTAKQAWQASQLQRGMFFGDGALPVQFGFVQQQYLRPETLAAVAGGGAPAANDHGAGGESAHPALQLLNFRAFAREVRSLSWDEWKRSDPALSLAGKTVFFGAAYSSDDRFVTPIDDLYGVSLHAAGFVSLRNPISVAGASWAFAADIGIGMLFGAMVGRAWQGYLRARLSRASADRNRRAFAFAYLWLLVAAYAFTLWLLMQVALYWVAAQNVWISPLPMALGMTLDAFIIGAVNALEHVSVQHRTANSRHPGDSPAAATRPERLVLAMKAAFWLFIVGYAVLLIAQH